MRRLISSFGSRNERQILYENRLTSLQNVRTCLDANDS